MHKLVSIPLLSSLLASPAWAISNIEDQRPGPPEEGVSGSVELGLSGKTGDSREEDYTLNARLNYRQGDEIFFVIGSREYGSTRDIKDDDNSFVHARWMHQLNAKWTTEAFVQWEQDVFSNLVSRRLAGGGLRYAIASKEDVFSLAVGAGGFREYESLDLGTTERDSQLWRCNTYLSYSHQLSSNTAISSTTYVQPAVDDFDDLRALFTMSLNVKVSKALNLRVSYEAKYDSRPAKNLEASPPIDKEKVNTEYLTSLVYRF
ncbi:MAG TPA: DUF481 domain-containing protein [Marinagarivorans sp.]